MEGKTKEGDSGGGGDSKGGGNIKLYGHAAHSFINSTWSQALRFASLQQTRPSSDKIVIKRIIMTIIVIMLSAALPFA